MSFKGGFASFIDGYTRSQQATEDRNRLAQDRADAKERQLKEDTYRDEQRAREKKSLEEADALRAGLKASAQPVPIQFNSGRDASMDVSGMTPEQRNQAAIAMSTGQAYDVAGKTFADESKAKEASRTEQLRNIASFKANNGDPSDLIRLEDGLEQRKELAIEKAKKMAQEGVIQTAHASLTGSPEAVFSAYNSTGKKRMLEKPQVSKRVIDGMNTYDYIAKVQHEDGTVTNERFNSHELNLATVPYAQLLTHAVNVEKNRLAAARGLGGGSGGAGGNPQQADAAHGFDEKGALSYARKMVEDEIKGDPTNMIEPKPMTDAQAAKRVYDTRDAMRAEHTARAQSDLKQQMLIGSIRQAKTPQQLAQVVAQAQKLKYSKAEIDSIIAQYSPLVAE